MDRRLDGHGDGWWEGGQSHRQRDCYAQRTWGGARGMDRCVGPRGVVKTSQIPPGTRLRVGVSGPREGDKDITESPLGRVLGLGSQGSHLIFQVCSKAGEGGCVLHEVPAVLNQRITPWPVEAQRGDGRGGILSTSGAAGGGGSSRRTGGGGAHLSRDWLHQMA